MGNAGWVVAPEPTAAAAGLKVLEAGGTAKDAVIAAALVQGVADPLWSSIGGFGVALVRSHTEAVSRHIGFHAEAPLMARGDMFELASDDGPKTPGTFPVRDRANQIGYLSVGVPGDAAGLAAVAEAGATWSTSRLVEPAAQLLEDGVVVSRHVYRVWLTDERPGYASPLERFLATSAAAEIYAPDGQLPRPGSVIRNRQYANTLRRLGRDGWHDFYRGGIAAQIAQDFTRSGGLIRSADLQAYAVDTTPPLTCEYRGLRVEAPPLPSLGVVIQRALVSLAACDLTRFEPDDPAYIHQVATALSAAQRDMDYLVDPRPARYPAPLDRNTTHLCVVDAQDNLVSLTHSLGAASGVVTRGLGFIYNGAVHRFDPRPANPNSIAPGRRRPTGIAPTIVWEGDRPVAVIGSPGGLGILHGILQVLLNLIDHRMHPQLAVTRSRFSVWGTRLLLEGGLPPRTTRALEQLGWTVSVLPDAFDDEQTGRVMAVSRIGSREWLGGADPRGGGVALRLEGD
jgi:gamma-glutamyltranspeptidase/glutathione hydrolase